MRNQTPSRNLETSASIADADMEKKPQRRHWFRYSLRTLFAVVTLFALWLGRMLPAARHAVAEREVVMKRCISICDENSPSVRNKLPITWRLLGAKPIWFLGVQYEVNADELERIRSLFPESADILVYDSRP
ncbi:MAG TPA: hypothetical protein VGJ26_04945 [Pirellulales bacterium]|jgi:hypothetical protein